MNTDEHRWLVTGEWNVAMGTAQSPLKDDLCSSVFICGSTALFLQSVNGRKIAPEPIGVHAESEHVTVGDGDADEICFDGLGAADVLVGEHRAQHLARAHLDEPLVDRRECDALV